MTAVHRIDVRPRSGAPDPEGDAALESAAGLGLPIPEHVACSRIYFVEGDFEPGTMERVARELFTDPVTQVAGGAVPGQPGHASGHESGDASGHEPGHEPGHESGRKSAHEPGHESGHEPAHESGHESAAEPTADPAAISIEVHPLPGVMDPDAEPIETAIRAMLGRDCRVQTGRRYEIRGLAPAEARTLVERSLANTVIHAVHDVPWTPDALPAGQRREMTTHDIPICDLDDAALERLSREAHLFLDLEEMHAVQAHYRAAEREPKDIELETLAQTWSEHCVHKTLKATIKFDGPVGDIGRGPDASAAAIDAGERSGHERTEDGRVVIHNLLKSTVAAATHDLMAGPVDWCLSVFVDNAGIIAFDDDHAVCFKVETHNHPSAIEPYGGAATGIGGCIRDVIGTGLAARPIAATDVFCVARPDAWRPRVDGDVQPEAEAGDDRQLVPAGCLHPARILRQVVAGVRDYGNRMGIPTLNGAVWFDDDHIGNPLVYCGCVGVMPRDRIAGDPNPGDRIIALGGRTGRDGIHGATFSSAELTDTHADEFSHAVQIGNAVTEKKVLDVIIAAREGGPGGSCLFSSITDCGAGGFSSAVGEMGEQLGAVVDLDRAPLKYDGLTPTEIWISEAQERMVLAVPAEHVDTLGRLCREHEVEICDLGVFGTPDRSLVLRHEGRELGKLDMEFLHEGYPGTMREARWSPPAAAPADEAIDAASAEPVEAEAALHALLGHPNIASKHWIIRQYDHEVQGGSVVKPLVGPAADGPSDAAVVQPVESSWRGLAIANGLATGWREDPYRMALAAIDECVRNLACVGTDTSRIAILDNFCWPNCKHPDNLGTLVRAAEGCRDAATAYGTPFISGKDSLNNQFTTEDGTTIQIPPTLLISGFGIVDDLHATQTMDAKEAGNLLVVVGTTGAAMNGSHLSMLGMAPAGTDAGLPPGVDLVEGPKRARAVSQAVSGGIARAAHDCSEGGLLLAAAEMAMAGRLGVDLDLALLPTDGDLDPLVERFAETPSRYLLEVERARLDDLDAALHGQPYAVIGAFTDTGRVRDAAAGVDASIEDLLDTWKKPLDW
ncbi:MAG: AIR synthase-related protein [Phycisphaerales bacterium]